MKRVASQSDGASNPSTASLFIEYDNETTNGTDHLDFSAHSNWRLQQHPMICRKMH